MAVIALSAPYLRPTTTAPPILFLNWPFIAQVLSIKAFRLAETLLKYTGLPIITASLSRTRGNTISVISSAITHLSLPLQLQHDWHGWNVKSESLIILPPV